MNTSSCVLTPNGVAIVRSDASESLIPDSYIRRSPVLRSVVAEVNEGSCSELKAPVGYIVAWLSALSTQDDDQLSVEDLGEGIIAADYLADKELVQRLCVTLGQAVARYCLSGPPHAAQNEELSSVPQVLDSLSGPLVATVLRAAPVSLTQQLRRLPPSTHPHAMHAAYPELESASSLSLDCGDLDATSATLALDAVAGPHQNPLHSLTVSAIGHLAALQAPNIPDEFASAVSRACVGVKHVSLDFRLFKAHMSASLLAVNIDPSDTEFLLRAIDGSTALESLELKSWEDAPVAAFLEGGGCARQLKSLKLDIEGPCSEAALQAMAACTALTHLSLQATIPYCSVLVASLLCMTQLEELHLELNVPEPPTGVYAEGRRLVDSNCMDPLFTVGFHFNPFMLRWGIRFQSKVMHPEVHGVWRYIPPKPNNCPSITNTPSADSELMNEALAHLTGLTRLSLKGVWFAENPSCVARAPHAAAALKQCSVYLSEKQHILSENIQNMLFGLDSLYALQGLSLSLKAPKTRLRLKEFWASSTQQVFSLLDSLCALNLYSVCTFLQLSVLPQRGNLLHGLWERLQAFTHLRRLQLSRLDQAQGRITSVQRLLAPQTDLALLGMALTNLTYLNIGVSFAATSQELSGGRGGAGRGGGRGQGRRIMVAAAQPAFCMSGLTCALRHLTLLQHLSMYSHAPDAVGDIRIAAPDEGEVQALGEAMQGLRSLSKLCLRGAHLCSAPMCRCFVQLPALKVLRLRAEFNGSKDWSESTMQGFSSLRQLISLTVGQLHSSQSLQHVAQLLDAVAPAGELEALEVGQVPGAGSAAAFQTFAGSLRAITGLQVLEVWAVRFVKHCAVYLAEALVHLRQLKTLVVNACELNGPDMQTICHSPCGLEEVVSVVFDANRMHQGDVQHVRNILRGCERLNSAQLGIQMPFVQCPCCDYFTLPRWSHYHASLGSFRPEYCVCLRLSGEFIERWECPVCQWNSWETPGAEEIESLLDKQTEANSSTLRHARARFHDTRVAGKVQDGITCGLDEFARFEVEPRVTKGDVELA